jgi:hypothetical protein
MTKYMANSLRRLHQLNGPNGVNPAFALGTQLNWKFQDVPQTITALGRKHVSYMSAIRLNFVGNLTSTAGTSIPRKVLTPMLIASCQVQGTEIGTPVSSSHMLGGIIDTDSFIRSGGQNNLFNPPGIALAAATPKAFAYTVDIIFGNFSQRKGHQTCPLAVFMQPGEILVNTPGNLASIDASLTDVTISGMKVTAHAVILPDTEIRIANPWQMTRHKANAGTGTDSVLINSFGASSTLTGVQSKCGVHTILWASDSLIGPAKGSGTVASITQFAADFLGLRQNNDPRAIVQELFQELTDGQTLPYIAVTEDQQNPLYPFFDLQVPSAVNDLDIMLSSEFFPVLMPVRNFDASKLLEAVGNPSYDLTGTFTEGASHYTYMEGVYPFTMDKLNDLVAVIQRSHLGLEMYNTDDLILSTKTDEGTDLLALAASAPEKLTYLARSVVPKANPAVK